MTLTRQKKSSETIFTIYGQGEIRSELFRCFGWFRTLGECETCILNSSAGFLYECAYDYIVVEQFTIGVFPSVVSSTWFKWNSELEKYEKLKTCPIQFEHFSNFAMG